MADSTNLPDVKTRFIIDDSQVAEIFQKMSKQAETMGAQVKKGGETGALGAKSMGAAMRTMAREVGLTGAAARIFGNELADLTMALGVGVSMLGIVALGAVAAYKIYEHFTETSKKHREELQKSTSAALAETTALYANKLETEGVRKAKLELAKVNREIYLFNSAKLIKEETKALDELMQKQKEGISLWQKIWIGLKLGEGEGGVALVTEEIKKKQTEYNAELDLTIKQKQAELNITKETRTAATVKPVTFITDESNPFWQQDQQKSWLASQQTDYLTARKYQIEYNAARIENAKSAQMSLADVQQLELQNFDRNTSLMVLSAKNRDAAEAVTSTRSIQRATLEMNQKKQLNQMEMQNKATMLGGISQVMDQAYQLGGEKMKAFFYLSKFAAASEAFINYELAAAKAVGQTGIFGLPMEAYFHAMAGIVPALIMAQAFTGTSGGGATPTYSANSTTGLPTSTQGTQVNLTVNINGQDRNIGEIMKEGLQYLYNQNGSSGGLSVNVSRSA